MAHHISGGRCLTLRRGRHAVRLWDLDDACSRTGSGPPKPTLTIDHGSAIVDMAWAADGRRFATVTESNLYIYSAAGERQSDFSLDPSVVPTSLCWAPDGTRLACTCTGRLVILTLTAAEIEFLTIPAPSLERAGTLFMHASHFPFAIEWSPDGTQILVTYNYILSVFSVVGSADAVIIFDAPIQINTGLFRHFHDEPITSAHWSPDSLRIAVTGGANEGNDIGIIIFDVKHRNMMVLDNDGGDCNNTAGRDSVAWYNDGSAVVVARRVTYETDNDPSPIDVYKVPSPAEQQALFQGDGAQEHETDDFGNLLGPDDVPSRDGGPRSECCDVSDDEDEGAASYWDNDLDQRCVQDRRFNFHTNQYEETSELHYKSTKHTRKCEEAGYCAAIAQGRIVGIDRLSTEQVIYIRPRDYLPAEGDAENDYSYKYRGTCFAAIRLPYESIRPLVLDELSRALLLVTSGRASVDASDEDSAAFFDIVGRLRGQWEDGVGLVLAYVGCAVGAAWPRGEPTWEDGHMVSS